MPTYEQLQTKSEQFEQLIADRCRTSQTDPRELRIKNPFLRLKRKLDDWADRCPVLGYNSSSFDINALRSRLFPMLQKEKNLFMICKGKRYTVVKTGQFLLLDMCEYLRSSQGLK